MESGFAEKTAANNLASAIASLHGKDGYAVPNRFEVIITRPGSSATESKNVSMRCESINLPGRNLNSGTDSNIYGPTREVVNGVTYAEDVTLTFQSSSGLEERKYFEQWQENMFNPDTWNLGYYNDYVGAVEIYLLDKQEQRRYGLKLWEAFPKTINATALNAGSNNEIIKVDIGFSFRYWT